MAEGRAEATAPRAPRALPVPVAARPGRRRRRLVSGPRSEGRKATWKDGPARRGGPARAACAAGAGRCAPWSSSSWWSSSWSSWSSLSSSSSLLHPLPPKPCWRESSSLLLLRRRRRLLLLLRRRRRLRLRRRRLRDELADHAGARRVLALVVVVACARSLPCAVWSWAPTTGGGPCRQESSRRHVGLATKLSHVRSSASRSPVLSRSPNAVGAPSTCPPWPPHRTGSVHMLARPGEERFQRFAPSCVRSEVQQPRYVFLVALVAPFGLRTGFLCRRTPDVVCRRRG